MAGVLEWVAREQRSGGSSQGSQQPSFTPVVNLKHLVDVQDVHGDTALIVAARVGNRGLIKFLLNAGADRALTNKLGLKPEDFGVEMEVR
jgi:regulatory protein SWI6